MNKEREKTMKKEDIELAAFSVDKIGVFTAAEVKALKKLGIRTLKDLDTFSTMIQDVISDIVRIESVWMTNFTESDKARFLALKVIDITKFYKPMPLADAGDKTGYKCVSVNLQFNVIDPRLNIPVFTVTGCEKNEEISKMLTDDIENDL